VQRSSTAGAAFSDVPQQDEAANKTSDATEPPAAPTLKAGLPIPNRTALARADALFT
jgi:hypothetical protein